MNAATRHSLVRAALHSGLSVTEKSASASPAQQEVLNAVWPDGTETTKTAALARVIASGVMVEEAEEAARG